ncbi:acyltransferase family protein [Halomonas ventosae]|uniref:acyltransferase family protein n=1 Tax=Halomonas ventosae TaxID=229007 RepID=UPI0010610792|nr:acyltransferase family protein [Halomonas ventosae]
MKNRKEIDGLRAVAVLPVILYHAGFSWFSGGYVGVDVFFVISGYLITSILISEISDGTFSIARFYERRARRILPALAFVSICTFFLAWIWMLPSQFKDFSQSLVALSLFSSNILFWKESNYFSPAAEEKPMLHTWSLAVEEQFYIFFPIILLLLWRFGRNPAFYTIMIISLVSLLLSEYGWRKHPDANFYLLPSRAWELGAGAICAFALQGREVRKGSLLSSVGFALILYSVVFYDETVPFPSLYTLVPVVGTALIILYGEATTPIARLLSRPLLVGIGLISFSAYLWHQPLLAFARIRSLTAAPSWTLMGFLSLASIVLAYFTWKYIETPFRKGGVKIAIKRKSVFVFSGVASFMLAGLGVHGHLSNGADYRFSPSITELLSEVKNINPRRSECHVGESGSVPECTYGGEELGAIVIGDSHAAALIRAVERAMNDSDKHVLDWTMNSCATISGVKSHDGGGTCGEFVEYAVNKSHELRSDAPLIIINRLSSVLLGPNEPYRAHEVDKPSIYLEEPHNGRSELFFKEISHGFIETACEFSKSRDVFILRPIPELKVNVPEHMAFTALLNEVTERVRITRDEYNARNDLAWRIQDEAAEKCGVEILDPTPYLCANGSCWGDVSGRPIYYDDDHLSEHGGDVLLPLLSEVFN